MRKIGQSAPQNLAAVVAEQRDGQQSALARFFERHDDVARSAAGGDADRNIFGRACAISWRRKITSVPTSLAIAVMLAGSSDNETAGTGR